MVIGFSLNTPMPTGWLPLANVHIRDVDGEDDNDKILSKIMKGSRSEESSL